MERRGRVAMTVRIYLDLATEDAMIVPPGEFAVPDRFGTCAVMSIVVTGTARGRHWTWSAQGVPTIALGSTTLSNSAASM